MLTSVTKTFFYLPLRKKGGYVSTPFVCLFVCPLKYSKIMNRFGDIFVGMEHAQGTMDDSGDHDNFQCFRWLFFGNFRDEASVIIW